MMTFYFSDYKLDKDSGEIGRIQVIRHGVDEQVVLDFLSDPFVADEIASKLNRQLPPTPLYDETVKLLDSLK